LLTRLPIRLLVFALITGLMLAGGFVHNSPGLGSWGETRRLLVGALEASWWLGAAWLAVGFLRAFAVLGRRPRESQLIKDLFAAFIYLAAAFAIVAQVFDLPVKGLLATTTRNGTKGDWRIAWQLVSGVCFPCTEE
jgi:hypothetical protein